MNDRDRLEVLLSNLDGRTFRDARLVAAYEGRGPLTYLAPELRAQLNDRLTTVSVNIPRLLVDSIGERLRITGFTDPRVWSHFEANRLPTMSGVAHREALMLGDCYLVTWARDGRPLVTVESATQMVSESDPATRELTYAAKRWTDSSGTHAILYGPEVIRRYHTPSTGAYGGMKLVDSIENPFGIVPVARLRNGDRLVVDGISEMLDVLPLSDALTKLTTDLLVASEYTARPRRWTTGIELEEDEFGNIVNPIPEGHRAMISESPDAKFGQLPGSDLAGYQNGIRTLLSLISAVTGLPEHMLGVGSDNPTSADSIRASEAALTAKAEARQRLYSLAWDRTAQLMIAAETGADPLSIDVRTEWADAAHRSMAQDADATVKLVQAGILPTSYALKRLGYSDSEIAKIEAARRADALNSAGTDLSRLAL